MIILKYDKYRDRSSSSNPNHRLCSEERHQTDPGLASDDLIENSIFAINIRSKPSLVKVAPKIVKINRSESHKVFSSDKLSNEDEKSDIDNELEMNENYDIYDNIDQINSKMIVTEPSNPTENAKIDLQEADYYSK